MKGRVKMLYTEEIEQLKKKINNTNLKTHVGARVCNSSTCSNKGNVIITSHYVCPCCGWGLDTLEGYDPSK